MRAFALLSLLSLTAVLAHTSLPQTEVLDATTLEEFHQFVPPPEEPRRLAVEEDSKPLLAGYYGGVPGFYHGVASGDPLPNAVIVWTRFTPVNAGDKVDIELRMAKVDATIPFAAHLDPSSNPNLKRAVITVTGANDWVAKIDVTGLDSGSNYVFAFTDGVTSSIVGQTKTAPAANAPVSELTYAVFSCAHFANGYFHPYDIASTITDLDFWIHVGDYVYEYGKYSTYASAVPERKKLIMPDWEQISVQDHRLRFASYSLDEGLENLRRRAPLIAIWDDHETTNNAYGQGSEANTGAENHQPVCTANATSPDKDKESAKCDRDEGTATQRFLNAAQAYMEWMPLRKGPGIMGVVTTTSITQVIEWGTLATVVALDSRLSHRSKEPTLRSAFPAVAPVTFANNNVSSYSDPSSAAYATLKNLSQAAQAVNDDPKFTMIGEMKETVLQDAFQKSKNAGKTWQIWAQATMMGPNKAVNFARAAEVIKDPTTAATVKGYFDAVLAGASGGFFRSLVAMDVFDLPWNNDDYSGFGHERAAILDMVQTSANNPIILGGDLHDSWAWTLYDKGAHRGRPVAVNLGCPGVTSPGWGPFLGGLFGPITAALGGDSGVYKLLSDLWELQNDGLVYGNVEKKGFFAVKANRVAHTAEYFLTGRNTTVTDYAKARAANGRITAEFECDASLTTLAGSPGNLVEQDICNTIKFDAARPAVWSLPVPIAPLFAGTKLTNCGMDGCVSSLFLQKNPAPALPPTRAPVVRVTPAPIVRVTSPVKMPKVKPAKGMSMNKRV